MICLALVISTFAVLLQAQDSSAKPKSQLSSTAQETQTPSTSAPPKQPGQLPDTMSAPPFTTGDKFEYRVVQSFGARGFVGAAIGAAIGQALNSPHEWGQEVSGFAHRYGSGFSGNFSRQVFAFSLETAFHEDPRYFPSEDTSKKEKAINALRQIIRCKTDAGGDSFAYARVFSAFGAGQFINVWQPKSTGSVADGVKRGFISLGADAAYNFMQEFIPFTRPISIRRRH